MSKTLLGICLILAALTPANANACLMGADEKAALFKTYDSDSDGEISVDEFLLGEKSRKDAPPYNEENLLEHFIDTDHDGSETLSPEEFSPTNGNKRCSD